VETAPTSTSFQVDGMSGTMESEAISPPWRRKRRKSAVTIYATKYAAKVNDAPESFGNFVGTNT